MIRVVMFALLIGLTGCGDGLPTKRVDGSGSTTPGTIKAPPKGQRPTME